MAQPKNINLHPDAHEQLVALKSALPEEGVVPNVRLEDIASALILYTPPQQAAGMLAAFSRHIGDEATGSNGLEKAT
jgi:hypothetical protein